MSNPVVEDLRYLQRFLEKEFSISMIENVKPSHIKQFLSMMDDAGRKPQYKPAKLNNRLKSTHFLSRNQKSTQIDANAQRQEYKMAS